jgi:hypothetical protein
MLNMNKEAIGKNNIQKQRMSRKRALTKPHTIQHKSTKGTKYSVYSIAYIGVIQKSQIQQNIDKARDTGSKILAQEVIYKYKINNPNVENYIK